MSPAFLLYAALPGNAISVLGGFWCTCPNWLFHLYPELLHQCLKIRCSSPFRRKDLSWTSFSLVSAISSPVHSEDPRFLQPWRSGTKRPPSLASEVPTNQNRCLSFVLCDRLWDFERSICAYVRPSQSVSNCHSNTANCTANYRLVIRWFAKIISSALCNLSVLVTMAACPDRGQSCSSFSSEDSLHLTSNTAPVDRRTFIHSTQQFMNVSNPFFISR